MPSRTLSVLHVIPAIDVAYGGPVTTMYNMIKVWESNGIASHILAIKRGAGECDVGPRVTLVNASFPRRFSNSREAVKWFVANFRRFNLVVFHSTWSALNIAIAILSKWKRVPYVVVSHGSLDPFDLCKKALAKQLLGPILVRSYLNASQGVLCSTKLEAERLVTYKAAVNITVLPWVVERETPRRNRCETRYALGLRGDEFVVLSLGRIDYKKGFPVLLPAVQQLHRCGIRTKLLIVGPDSNGYTDVVRRMIQDLRIASAVSLMPPVMGSEKAELMQAADCFALPSLNENFGNTVVEAMQQGTPVVISNNVYIANIIADYHAGVVCGYDVDDVFHALRRLAENPEERMLMSKRAAECGSAFLPNNLSAKYVRVFESFMNKNLTRN